MPRFAPDRLTAFTASALTSAGIPSSDAHLVAESLVEAELEGQSSHGLRQLPPMLTRLHNGLINPRPALQVSGGRTAVALLDADNSLGQVAGARALELSAERAQQVGAGLVAVRRSNALGALSFYLRRFASRGMIGLVFSNAPPSLAPPGSDVPYLGTNPIAAGIPTSGQPVLVDLAITQLAGGRILQGPRLATPIPEGWAVGQEGHADLIGDKAFALALLVEVMSGVLSGAAIGPDVGQASPPLDRESNVGHCFIAVDPQAATPDFTDRMDHVAADLRRVSGHAPGDRRHARREQQLAGGVELSEEMVGKLTEVTGNPI
jgi:LDH2 family malate/lactate/ureidoglycolate dehydrogenase